MQTYENISYHNEHEQQQNECSQFLCGQQVVMAGSSSCLGEKSIIMSGDSTTTFVPEQPGDSNSEQAASAGQLGRRESSLMCEHLEQVASFRSSPSASQASTTMSGQPAEELPNSGEDQPSEQTNSKTNETDNKNHNHIGHYVPLTSDYQNEHFGGPWQEATGDQFGQQAAAANNQQYFNASSPLRESTNTRQDGHQKRPQDEHQQHQMVDANYNNYCYQPDEARYQSYSYDQGQQQQTHPSPQNVALYDVGGDVIEYRPVIEHYQPEAQVDYYDHQHQQQQLNYQATCYSRLEPATSSCFYADAVDPNNNNHYQHDYYNHQENAQNMTQHLEQQENDSCKTYTSLERSSRTRDLLADPYNLGPSSSSLAAPTNIVHHIPAAVDGNEPMEVADWSDWLPSATAGIADSHYDCSSSYHNQQVPIVSQSYDPSSELNWNFESGLIGDESDTKTTGGGLAESSGWSAGDSNEEEDYVDEDEEDEEEDDEDDDGSVVSSELNAMSNRRPTKRAPPTSSNLKVAAGRGGQASVSSANLSERPKGCAHSTILRLRTFLMTRMPRRPAASEPAGTSMLVCKKAPAGERAAQTVLRNSAPKAVGEPPKPPSPVRESALANVQAATSNSTQAERAGATDKPVERPNIIVDNRQLRNRTIFISTLDSQVTSRSASQTSAAPTATTTTARIGQGEADGADSSQSRTTCSGVQTRARKRQRQIEQETTLSGSSSSLSSPSSSRSPSSASASSSSSYLCSTSSACGRCRRGRSSSSTSSSILQAGEISMDCN